MALQPANLPVPVQPSTASLEIVQIVPRLPPHTDGVGDYALRLSEQLWADHRIYSHFLVFTTGLEFTPLESGFPIHSLAEHSITALLSTLPVSAQGIILHYSNYPYLKSPLDLPFWLPKALEQGIHQRQIPLVVMFHELPTLKIKTFKIINPLQIHISRWLTKIAHGVITDSAQFQAYLSRWTRNSIPCIPDFSTVGEPSIIPPLSDRQRRIVIFGGNDRGRVYKYHLPKLLSICKHLAIQEIVDIGRPLALNAQDFGDIRLIEMGFQPAEVVSQMLLTAIAGMIDYTRFPGDLGKSTVFAAFTAHGVLPISTVYNPSEGDGLHLNQHYLTPETLRASMSPEQLQGIATTAHTWYESHSLRENAKVFAQQFTLQPSPQSPQSA
ncbi:hypothetical protein [Leptolyngbya sp. PCC 6406]|uniref:hypothetical protein n=1 Tax=Leptolyngbya sp. PCC 6406 TaxID=1173264 RepID=UPI0002ABEA05|nr:hypothetical protein [Leptolyngbya sp. PCC 6406]